MRRQVPGWLLFLLIATAVAAQTPPRAARPLDPLTSEEKRVAQEIAASSPEVRQRAGEVRLIYVQFISVKRGTDANEPNGRHADVLFHIDPDQGGIRVLVDLQTRRVASVVSVPEPSVPISESDVERAARIALANPGVQSLLGERASSFTVFRRGMRNQSPNTIDGLHSIGVRRDDPCTIHRCIALLFRSNGRLILTEQQITVDLTTGAVMQRGGRR